MDRFSTSYDLGLVKPGFYPFQVLEGRIGSRVVYTNSNLQLNYYMNVGTITNVDN